MLSATAQRIMRTLPDYYWGNPEVERSTQAFANEVDRADAAIDAVILGMIPTAATDTLGMLALWERTFRLPVRPAGATVPQRQAAIATALRQQNAVSAADVLAILELALGTAPTITRDAPEALHDTVAVPFAPGSYLAARTAQLAAALWPAARAVHVQHADGSTVLVPRPTRTSS